MALKQVPAIIEGARLRLRRSSPDDAPDTFRAANDAEVMKYMEWPANRTPADARAHLEGCEARWTAGTEYHWVIVKKPSTSKPGEARDEVIGAVSCRVQGHAADFGVLLARAAWGQGYGTEAAGLLVGWLKRQGDIVRIWATTDIDNTRSARVLDKLGFAREGVLRSATQRPQLGGAARDTVVHAWVREP
jgi:[ribosomal protein S5]-alanine N-acetyltransferase